MSSVRKIHVSLDLKTAAELDRRLRHPETGVLPYGARSKLLERLLKQWLAAQAARDEAHFSQALEDLS